MESHLIVFENLSDPEFVDGTELEGHSTSPEEKSAEHTFYLCEVLFLSYLGEYGKNQ